MYTPINHSDRIKAPLQAAPVGNLHAIGAYVVPSILSRRGNAVLDGGIEYNYGNGGALHHIFPNAKSNETRAWFI